MAPRDASVEAVGTPDGGGGGERGMATIGSLR